MERYSAQMTRNVQVQLQQASADYLAVLVPGFLKRQGPGLRLLRHEFRRRGLPFPPACPVCGQQRNRCICLPWLNSKAQQGTHSHGQ